MRQKITNGPMVSLSSPATARLLGVDNKSIHNWVARGLLKAHKTPGGHLRFAPAEIARLLRSMGMPVPASLLDHSVVPLPAIVRRVFVAGPSSELDRCAAAIHTASRLVEVTLDWTALVRRARAGLDVPPDAAQAASCLEAVAAADLVWLLLPSAGHSTVGAWFEGGFAVASRKPVVASLATSGVGRRFGVFPPPYASIAHLVASDEVVLALLRERVPGGPR